MMSPGCIESVEFTITIPTTQGGFTLRHGCLKEYKSSFSLKDYNVDEGSSVKAFGFAVMRYLIRRTEDISAG